MYTVYVCGMSVHWVVDGTLSVLWRPDSLSLLFLMNHDSNSQNQRSHSHALRTRHEQSQHGSGQIRPVHVDAIQGLHCRTCAYSAPAARHNASLFFHFGPSFDPSSHSTDGYSQTCMYLDMLNCIPQESPLLLLVSLCFYSSTCLHGLDPFSTVQHPLHQVLIAFLVFSRPGK